MKTLIKTLILGFIQITNSQKLSNDGEICGGRLKEPHNCLSNLVNSMSIILIKLKYN